MRAHVVVLGAVETTLHLRVREELRPHRPHHADPAAPRVGGAGFELARAISRLGLTAGLAARVGGERDARDVVDSLRAESILTGGLEHGDAPTPLSVRIETPSRSYVLESGGPAAAPAALSPAALDRLFRGARHVHACAARAETRAAETLARAREQGASTSLSLGQARPAAAKELSTALEGTDLLFAPAERLRELAGERRLGRAVELPLRRGVSTIVADLGAGGCRVYASSTEPVRVPSLGEEAPGSGAFVGAFLLGWLGRAPRDVCGVLASAARLAGRTPEEPPDRRELARRLARARTRPSLRRLVPSLLEAERFLEGLKRLPPRSRQQ